MPILHIMCLYSSSLYYCTMIIHPNLMDEVILVRCPLANTIGFDFTLFALRLIVKDFFIMRSGS